jgi:hypothetical protein
MQALDIANEITGAQKKYIDGLDYLSKLFTLVTKFVNPVPTKKIINAKKEMSNPGEKGGNKRNNKRSLRKTKKIRRFVKRVRKTKRKGKK